MRSTRLLISKEKVKRNIDAAKKHLPAGTALMAVVKGNAYGHGMCSYARYALDCGADWLAVAISQEGEELRRAGITAPILVLGAYDRMEPLLCIEQALHQAVCSAEDVYLLEKNARLVGKNALVHIKVNSGMNRLGISTPADCQTLIDALKNCPHVIADGMFTHFHSADTEYETRTKEQYRRFSALVDMVRKSGIELKTVHAANSAGILQDIAVELDAVRWGISLYGYYPSEYIARKCKDAALVPAAEWVTVVSALHRLQPGEGVGYGATFVAEKPAVIATLPVGYADGLNRLLSNKGQVILHGQLVPIVGRVCMDQVMVDVTALANVQVGDEAVLIGKRGSVQQTADDMARLCGTISYEILTSISPRVARCWVD